MLIPFCCLVVFSLLRNGSGNDSLWKKFEVQCLLCGLWKYTLSLEVPNSYSLAEVHEVISTKRNLYGMRVDPLSTPFETTFCVSLIKIDGL